MRYKALFEKKALKKLKKMDAHISAYLISWIKKNLHNTKDPRSSGKALTGDMSGLWRYRVGNYRIVANIKDNEVIILIIDVSHRKNVYRK